MALDDMFGFQAGARQRTLDDAALRKAALDDRQSELKIKSAEVELAGNEAFAEAVRSSKMFTNVVDEGDVPDVLTQMGNLAIATGNFTKGKDLLLAGSTVQNQHSLMARREAKTAYENMDMLGNIYSSVGSEREWNQANAMFEMVTGQPSPFAGTPYSPMMVEQARAATTSEKDRAAAALTEARQGLVQSQQAESSRRQALIDAQIDYTKERTKNLEKVGGKPVPGTYVTAVSNELKEQFLDIGENDSARIRAIALPYAEEAYNRVQQNGLSLSQAVQEVLAEAEENGELGGWTPMDAMGSGSHPSKPLEVPTDKKGVLDVAKLKPNKYYIIPGTGRIFLRTRDGRNLAVDDLPDDADEGLDDEDEENWDDEDEE